LFLTILNHSLRCTAFSEAYSYCRHFCKWTVFDFHGGGREKGFMLRDILKADWLSDFDGVRENNFTILKFFLAFTVLFGHSFPISGNGSDPITMLIVPHPWIGRIAVGGSLQ